MANKWKSWIALEVTWTNNLNTSNPSVHLIRCKKQLVNPKTFIFNFLIPVLPHHSAAVTHQNISTLIFQLPLFHLVSLEAFSVDYVNHCWHNFLRKIVFPAHHQRSSPQLPHLTQRFFLGAVSPFFFPPSSNTYTKLPPPRTDVAWTFVRWIAYK